jgi:hypothetical protein
MSDAPQPASSASVLPVTGITPVPGIDMESLLVNEPLHSRKLVRYALEKLIPALSNVRQPSRHPYIEFPEDIRAHCEHPKCEGVRRFEKIDSDNYSLESTRYAHASFRCTNCQEKTKLFTLKVELGRGAGTTVTSAYCTKVYQDPPFGAPIPKRLFALIGEDNREHFLNARRAIARSLGIGAYAYYRRIVENTKFDLVSSILEVAKATNAPTEQIELLEAAKKESQFSKAMDILKAQSAIPSVLLIDGHNPLALLHDLLSQGIHQLADSECLERAKEAEIILSEIAERMQIALTERKAVKSVIASIMSRKKQAAAQGE